LEHWKRAASNTEEDSTSISLTAAAPAEKGPRNSKRSLSISTEKRGKPLSTLTGGCCIKYEEEPTADSKAVQCDLCGLWIQAVCENTSDDVYDSMNAVLVSVNNFAYYCEANNCYRKIRQILFKFLLGEVPRNLPMTVVRIPPSYSLRLLHSSSAF